MLSASPKRVLLGAIAISATLSIVGVLGPMMSCKKNKERRVVDSTEPSGGSGSAGAPVGETKVPKPTKAAGPMGTVRGVVKFNGKAPVMPLINNGSDPVCAKTEIYAETIVVNAPREAAANGGSGTQTLRNALVRVKPKTVAGYVPSTPVEVKQVNCMYRPRIQGGVAGQKLLVHNTDGTAHNVHVRAAKIGDRQGAEALWNRQQPSGAQSIQSVVEDIPVMRLKCDVHGWMSGYVVVSDNPYHGVSGDDGNFEFVAPAGNLKIEAWHEFYGLKELEVDVPENGSVTIQFVFDADADDPIKSRNQVTPEPKTPGAVKSGAKKGAAAL